MKILIILVTILCSNLSASDGYIVDHSVINPGTDDLLQYDDGDPYWIISGYSQYATWFDVEDFIPGGCAFDCEYSEWWFYHHINNPWDTNLILLELWEGDVSGPTALLRSDSVNAMHMTSVVVNYSPSVLAGPEFWLVANTTVYSVSGVPSPIYDETANFTGTAHSFGWDGVLLEPIVRGGVEINAFFRVFGWIANSLENESWAAIKGLFR